MLRVSERRNLFNDVHRDFESRTVNYFRIISFLMRETDVYVQEKRSGHHLKRSNELALEQCIFSFGSLRYPEITLKFGTFPKGYSEIGRIFTYTELASRD